MGAKKKKNLANRLARMTDEERARYLQLRADAEEEARRRKEQLIATFMKNKLRKEEAFSRLNLSKINQYWHQILRKAKCKEMKEELEHMKKWIERILYLKNRTIDNLSQELEEAEEQYCTNLQAHLEYIDNIIGYHIENIDRLNKSYEEERDYLIEITEQEMQQYLEKATNDLEYLKTIAYGQSTEAKAIIKKEYDYHMTLKEEIICEYRSDLEGITKDREKISAAIWREIAGIVRAYIQQTDKRRAHLAELMQIDADSAVEVSSNQDRINHEEEQIERMKLELITLKINRTERIQELQDQIKYITKELFLKRNFLNKKIDNDEKYLLIMTTQTNGLLNRLEAFRDKGEQILFLLQTCNKLQTEEEQLLKFKLPKSLSEEEEYDESSKEFEENGQEKTKETETDFELEPEECEEDVELRSSSTQQSSSELSSKKETVDGVAKISAMLKKTVVEVMDKDKGRKKKTVSCKDEYLRKSFRKEIKTAPGTRSKELLKMTTLPMLPQRKPYLESPSGKSKSQVLFEKIPLPTIRSPKECESLSKIRPKTAIRPKSTKYVKRTIDRTTVSNIKTNTTKQVTITDNQFSLRKTKSAASLKQRDKSIKKQLPSQVQDNIFDEFVSAPKEAMFLRRTFESLQDLDGMWYAYNKVYIELKELKGERKSLSTENKSLRGMIRAILEAAALDKTGTNSRVSTRVGSRYRGVISAPYGGIRQVVN